MQIHRFHGIIALAVYVFWYLNYVHIMGSKLNTSTKLYAVLQKLYVEMSQGYGTPAIGTDGQTDGGLLV